MSEAQQQAPAFEEKMSAAMRVHCVRQKVEYLKKAKKVESYLAVTHDQVTDYIRDALIEYALLVVPSMSAGTGKTVPTGTFTSRSVPFVRFEAEYDICFVNVHKPEDMIVSHLAAHAIDHGDKAPGKAMSYAVKMAELKMFLIVTGEDDEERSEQTGGMSPQDIANWKTAIDALASHEEVNPLWTKILAACKEKDDKAAATQLRGHITAKGTALRKAAAPKPQPQKKAA